MTTEADAVALVPFYGGIVSSVEKALAASRLDGLDEELRSLRAYVSEYGARHPDDFAKIITGMRLIMQMVLAQHRMGAQQMQQSIEAMERVSKEMREMMAPIEEDDL